MHAFEPTPALAERIRLNSALNEFTHVKVNEVAVAAAIGTALLHISSEDPEANSLFALDDDVGRLAVSTSTLCAYVSDGGVHRIDLLKIDCEGSELQVLRGAATLLTKDNGPIILLECNPDSLSACGETVSSLCDYLHNGSYDCYCLEQLRNKPNPVWNLPALKRTHSKGHRLVEELLLKRFDSSYE